METAPTPNMGGNSRGGGGGMIFTLVFLLVAGVILYYFYGFLYGSTSVDSVLLVNGKQPADQSPEKLPLAPIPFEGGEYTFNTWFYVNSYNKNRNSRKHLFELRGKYFSTLVVALGAFRNTLTIRTHTRDATEGYVGFEGFQNAAVPAEIMAAPPPSGGGWKGFEGFTNFGRRFIELFQTANDLATNYTFTIRKLNIGTSRVANFVTKGTSSSGPFGIVADADGNVYVADTDNHVIRKIASDGTATILAGTGSSGFANQSVEQGASAVITITSQFNRPMGLAMTGSTLYVADTGNNRIRAINLTTKEVSTVVGLATTGRLDGGSAVATFNGPQGLVFNSSGTELFVADTDNHLIRKITGLPTTPMVATLAGAGVAGATDANSSTTLTTQGTFNRPTGIVVDGTGKVHIADTGNHKIRLLTPGVSITTVAGSGTAGFMDGTGATARFSSPKGLALDTQTGNLYIADSGNNRIRFIPTSGTVNAATIAGSNVSGNLNTDSLITSTFKSPSGLFYLNGNLFIGDGADPAVATVPSATTTSTATTTTTTTGTSAGTLTTTTGGGTTTTTGAGGTSSTTSGAMGGGTGAGTGQPTTTAPPGVSATDGVLNAGSMNSFFGAFAMDDDLMTSLPACDLPEFDLQRWVMLTVVLNGRTIDVYMDGKLVRSCTTKSFYKVDPSGVKPVLCDRGGFDGFISNPAVANYAMNPDQIYRTYLSGPEGGTLNILSWIGGLFSGSAAK